MAQNAPFAKPIAFLIFLPVKFQLIQIIKAAYLVVWFKTASIVLMDPDVRLALFLLCWTLFHVLFYSLSVNKSCLPCSSMPNCQSCDDGPICLTCQPGSALDFASCKLSSNFKWTRLAFHVPLCPIAKHVQTSPSVTYANRDFIWFFPHVFLY